MNDIQNRRRVSRWRCAAGLATVFALAGCAVEPPSNPTVMALPAKGKSLNEFQQDDYGCRNVASRAVQPQADSPGARNGALAAAALGGAGGAAVGALIGSASGNAGPGAAIGAGVGLLAGGARGSQQRAQTAASLQQQYDNAYAQCITAKGDVIEAPQPAPVAWVPVVTAAPPPVVYAPATYYYVPR
ncbi:glycine zipper domain-containing protein [Burkholderia plantarii]|uniref:Glycine zipper domain-containing protein n=1 Tax=Burkholderia plantarii TaxID=41899 RepID=A0A0B6RZ64_BURPL|nr:glycine zipper domain-containing protein [Burkholderia plantarii]AJK48693.1 hypothetical protein BGL_2c06090 [Burkholderia plantarii]ALK32925.1 hypothetical protein bpln_2g06670 [Burkholderia plantarii]